MARPIRIPFVSDVREFIRGTSDIERALDDVSDSLDDVGRDAADAGRDAGRALSDGIEDGARDAERAVDDLSDAGRDLDRIGDDGKKAFSEVADAAKADLRTVEGEVDQAAAAVESATERMERSFRDAFDGVKAESADAGRRVGDDTADGFDRAKAGAQEFRDEANSTARESAASFDGSAESVADAFQEVAANAFAGWGPAGAAAGLAAAAGIGFITKAWNGAKEGAEEFRERVRDVLSSLNEVRDRGGSAFDPIIDRLYEMADAAGEGDESLSRLREDAEGIDGLSFEGLAQGLAGDAAALREADGLLRDYREQIENEYLRAIRLQDTEGEVRWKRELDRADDLIGKVEEETDAQRSAAEERAALEAAGIDDLIRRQEQTEATNEAAATSGESHYERLQEARETNRQREEDMQQARVDAAREADQQITESVLGLTEAYQEVRDAAVEDGKITAEELIGILDQQLADQEARIAAWSWAQQNLTATQRQVLLDMGEDGQAALEGLINTTPELRAEALARLTAIGDRKGTAEASGVVGGLERTLPATVEGPAIRTRVDDSAWVRWANDVSRRGITVPVRVQTFVEQAV